MLKNSPDAIREAFCRRASPQVPAVLFGGGQRSVDQAGRLMREVATNADLTTESLLATQKKVASPSVFLGSGFNNILVGARSSNITNPNSNNAPSG